MILIENKTLFAFYIYIFSFEDLIPAPFSSQMLIMTWLSWFLYTRIVSFDKTTCDEQHCGCLNVCGTWMENQLPSKGQNSDPEAYCQRVQRTIEKKISYSRNHEDVKLSWFKFQEKRDFFFFFSHRASSWPSCCPFLFASSSVHIFLLASLPLIPHTLCWGGRAAVISVWQECLSSPPQPQVTCFCLWARTDDSPAAASMLQVWAPGISFIGIQTVALIALYNWLKFNLSLSVAGRKPCKTTLTLYEGGMGLKYTYTEGTIISVCTRSIHYTVRL